MIKKFTNLRVIIDRHSTSMSVEKMIKKFTREEVRATYFQKLLIIYSLIWSVELGNVG